MPQAQPTAPPSPQAAQLQSPQAPSPQAGPAQSLEAALRMLMAHLAQHFDVANIDASALGNPDRANEAQALVQASMNVLNTSLGSVDREALGQAALREAVGLGPLEDLLANDAVRELVVEGHQRILVDSGDGLKPIPEQFSSNFSVMVVAQRLCAQAGTAFSTASPIQHAALPYGPHVTVVMPPVAVRGPIIEVRRMGGGRNLEDLAKKGVIDKTIGEILRAAVEKRRNVLVSGPVDSGVTDLIGALASCLSEDTRVATVESTPDLVVDGPHVLSLSSGEPGTGLSLSDVADEASQLRVDWLVVDDARGSSARRILETIRCRQAGNIVGLRVAPGQKPEDTLQSVLRLNGESDASLHQLVNDSVDLVVQMGKDGAGDTRAVRIAEVTGPGESKDLVVYDGEFQSTGTRASFQ